MSRMWLWLPVFNLQSWKIVILNLRWFSLMFWNVIAPTTGKKVANYSECPQISPYVSCLRFRLPQIRTRQVLATIFLFLDFFLKVVTKFHWPFRSTWCCLQFDWLRGTSPDIPVQLCLPQSGYPSWRQTGQWLWQVALILKTNCITAAQFLLQPQYTDNPQNICERSHYKCT